MRLIVLRHGKTDWNETGRLQGRADPPLSAGGRRDVARWRLPHAWRMAPCWVSPLTRARETAELLGLNHYQVVPELIEMDWGAFEGETLADLRARLGAEMRKNEALGFDFRPPGGERPRDVVVRLRHWLERLPDDGDAALLITHKGVRRAFLVLATGWDLREAPPLKLRDGAALVLERDVSLNWRLLAPMALDDGQ